MAKFVRLVSFSSSGGEFDEKNDTYRINEVLVALQNKGAKIINVDSSIGGKGGSFTGSIAAVYTIIYEAPEPIEFE